MDQVLLLRKLRISDINPAEVDTQISISIKLCRNRIRQHHDRKQENRVTLL